MSGNGPRILLTTPGPNGVWTGNRTTSERWARMLRSLGCNVVLQPAEQPVTPDGYDLLIALHAAKSARAVRDFKRHDPDIPIIVGLAGTDLYPELERSAAARRSVDLADRLVVLQPHALTSLDAHARQKAHVVFQSARAPRRRAKPRSNAWEVAVVAHLRDVKDPLRTALAVRALPEQSRIRVVHVGAALSEPLARCARTLNRTVDRYRWLGPLPPTRTRGLLGRTRLLSQTSVLEGGANVVSEALVAGVPVVASRIAGNVGLLGKNYPGLFPVGGTMALRELLLRAEQDAPFYRRLKTWCGKRARLFHPDRERRAWARLLGELGLRIGR